MIRALIAQARAAVNNPGVKLAIAGMCLKVAADIIINNIEALRDEMDAVQRQLAQVRLESAAMADVMYPAPEDLDPLGRGTDSPIGDRLDQEYDRP